MNTSDLGSLDEVAFLHQTPKTSEFLVARVGLLHTKPTRGEFDAVPVANIHLMQERRGSATGGLSPRRRIGNRMTIERPHWR